MSFSKLNIKSDGLVEMETRIFLDDLTFHMQELYAMQQVDFSDVSSNGTQALQKYFYEQFYLEQDKERVNLRINAVGLSKNKLALVVHINSESLLDISKELILVNTLLCDANPVQVNDINYLGTHYQLGLNNPEVKLISMSSK